MENQIVIQRSPKRGAVLLIIGTVIAALSSVIFATSAVLNLISALTMPDDMAGSAMNLIINSISTIASDLAHNLLGLMPILCIVIAIFAIMKKKGLPMLIASAVMTIFTVSGLFGTIGSVVISYANLLTNLVSGTSFVAFGGIFDIIIVLNDYIIAPLSSLACSLALVFMWLLFTLLVLACADGKLGFLKKFKKVISAFFTLSVLLVIVCFIGNLTRYIAIDVVTRALMLMLVYHSPVSSFLNVVSIFNIAISILSALSTPIVAFGVLSIGAWMKNPTVTVTAPEESVNDTAEDAAEESAETVPEESNEAAEAEISE